MAVVLARLPVVVSTVLVETSAVGEGETWGDRNDYQQQPTHLNLQGEQHE